MEAEVAGDRSRSLRALRSHSLHLVPWGEELVKDQMPGRPCLFLLSLPPLTFHLRGGTHRSVSHLHGEEPPLLGKRRGVSPPASDTTVSPPLPAALCAPLTCRLLLLLPCSGCSLPACRSPARCLPAFQDRHFSASALSLPSSLSRTFHS